MRVFVTGASGHLGSALVPELLQHGHSVAGLARSDAAAARLAERGADVVRGDLDDLDGLHAAAQAADGVVHLAFRHDAMQVGDRAGAAESDLAALRTIADALAGTDKPLVGTSGTALVAGLGRPATEADTRPGGYRIDAENFVIDLAGKGIRTSVVRLPPTVHSDLDHHGFVPSLIGAARRHGFSTYVGDGTNRWPAVHTRDAAVVYRLALESAPGGTRLHAVADEGVEFRLIAEAIGHGVDVPARSIDEERAAEYAGWVGPFVGVDNPTSAARTRELLGWTPTHAGLLDDLAQGHYFSVAG